MLTTTIGPILVRFVVVSFISIYLSTLGGCVSGLAIVTSPDIAKLEKKADVYMVMETDIDIEGELRTIQVDWRCFQSPSFSANSGWYMRWQGDPKVGFAAKALPSGKYLIMGVGSIYCSNHNSSQIEHGQNVGILDIASSTLEIMSNKKHGKPTDIRIKRSIIRTNSAPEKIIRTSDELDIAKRFLRESPSYATIIVNIWDHTVWERDSTTKSKVESLRTLSFASDLHYPSSITGGGFGTFADRDGLLPGFTQIPIINGKLDLDIDKLKKPGRKIFGRNVSKERDFQDFEVCYRNQCRQLTIERGSGDQIYDPETRQIIRISWPITSIGQNLNELLE